MQGTVTLVKMDHPAMGINEHLHSIWRGLVMNFYDQHVSSPKRDAAHACSCPKRSGKVGRAVTLRMPLTRTRATP